VRPVRARNPWWIPPIFGRVPELEPRLVRLLGLVTLALFFESYDVSMLTAALKNIAADLGIPETALGTHLAAIRLGALPALLVVPLTDRIGRRRMFLVAMLGVSLGTFATAFAQSPLQFVAVQMLTRTFVLTGAAVAAVIVTEEFPAEHRGWGIGMMGALSACGFGLGAGLFAAIDVLPYGWRALYAVGVVPLLLLPRLRREVRETDRFTRHRASRLRAGEAPVGIWSWHRPISGLARTHPWRALGITTAAGLFAIGETSVFQFTGYFTQTVHGWSPGQYSAMVLVGGGVGIFGNVVAGQLGDRIGRRVVGCVFLTLFPVFAWLFYRGPGWSVPLAWTLFIFCETAAGAVIRAFSTELFPTSQRGTSAGWVSLVQTLGWAAGLALVGMGTEAPGDIARLTSALSLTTLAAAVVILMLPETRRRELEAISGEDAAARPAAG
jgi:MFS family permease